MSSQGFKISKNKVLSDILLPLIAGQVSEKNGLGLAGLKDGLKMRA